MIKLREFLNDSEMYTLKKYTEVSDSEQRQLLIKSFFHSPDIFLKFKPVIDPTWLSYDIFINKQAYGL